MPFAVKLREDSLDVVPRSYHASMALKTSPLLFCLPLPVSSSAFFFSSIGGERGLPSGLCRSSWRAPFEAFHSSSSPQDCTLLSWLCSINNSPPASLLPPSSFCSSPLSIYSCVRGGSVCACVWGKEGVRERELEVEWMREEMGRMLICMCFFSCLFFLFLSSHFDWDFTLRLSGFVLYWSVCVFACLHRASVSVCVYTSTTWFLFYLLHRQREIGSEKSSTVRGRQSQMRVVYVCVCVWLQTGKEQSCTVVWYNQLL